MGTKTAAAAIVAAVLCNASELTVRYYNEAKLSASALASAVETANRAMRTAEIWVRWIDCYRDPESCKGATGTAFDLTISGASAAREKKLVSFEMGYSLLPENGTGVYAKVLLSRVARYADTFDIPVTAVLGHVMAHEIGHLLLNTGEHSHAGIMKAVWTGSENRLLAGGRLGFHGREAAIMRRNLARR